ncbi:unnamed protein product [Penicillium salamii]|uniref:Secreted protein n=1 Tax=Penicillium salamii TaxID=1612424 RepID=A0A9W4JD29_9EURO|nr:unnamed protein product [Penicillium salamii]
MLIKYPLLLRFVHMTTWAPLDYILCCSRYVRPPRYTWIWANGKSFSGVSKRCRFQLIASSVLQLISPRLAGEDSGRRSKIAICRI